MPLTNSNVRSPAPNGRSSSTGASSRSTIASAGSSGSRSRPGSPWMPMPISISSAPSSNVGLPACGTVHGVSAIPMLRTLALTRSAQRRQRRQTVTAFGRGADDLLGEYGPAHTATAGGVEAVLDGYVVVDHHRLDLDPLRGGELGGGLEVEYVAGVVLDDVQDAGAAVDGLGRGQDRVGRRRGEHRARTGRVEHARGRRTRRAAARARCRRPTRRRPCRCAARPRVRHKSGRRAPGAGRHVRRPGPPTTRPRHRLDR